MLLRTTDPFRDLDRLTQQIFGTTNPRYNCAQGAIAGASLAIHR